MPTWFLLPDFTSKYVYHSDRLLHGESMTSSSMICRLCKCGKQKALPTFAQPRRLLRAEFAAKLKPVCSHLPGLSEGGSSDPPSRSTISLLQVFSMFRNSLHGEPCVVRVGAGVVNVFGSEVREKEPCRHLKKKTWQSQKPLRKSLLISKTLRKGSAAYL